MGKCGTALLTFCLALLAGLGGCSDAAAETAEDSRACQWLHKGTPPEDQDDVPSLEDYNTALKDLDMEAVKSDMEALLMDSQECWPADSGNYGPFFIRLAWHCSGSYRDTDKKGGCGGGRQRFEPERSWPDNTNLDKARALLYPLKKKYGHALSWGDLFITAGTVALRSMGAPMKQLCFGRVDDSDGQKSLDLGPTEQQDKNFPCLINGRCKKPLGATTVGLVYVNPEGPVTEKDGKPDPNPALSAHDIRDSFKRMGHSDLATVALVGGGHAFGKCHGACPKGAGISPKEAFGKKPQDIPWKGLCGTGKGKEAFTAGFEGPWTTTPLKWDNEYFKYLLSKKWEKHTGPGGHFQWRVANATGSDVGLMRLTADLALLHDPAYLKIVKLFAANQTALEEAFDEAWFKLTTLKGNPHWAKEAKCDRGTFPKDQLDHNVMLASDMPNEMFDKFKKPMNVNVAYVSSVAIIGMFVTLLSIRACRHSGREKMVEDTEALLTSTAIE